jgi:hypothetical protein
MEVGQGPNVGCSAKGKKNVLRCSFDLMLPRLRGPMLIANWKRCGRKWLWPIESILQPFREGIKEKTKSRHSSAWDIPIRRQKL